MSLEEDDAENALVAELRQLAGAGAADDGSFVPIALARLKVLLGSAVLTFLALVFVLLALRA